MKNRQASLSKQAIYPPQLYRSSSEVRTNEHTSYLYALLVIGHLLIYYISETSQCGFYENTYTELGFVHKPR